MLVYMLVLRLQNQQSLDVYIGENDITVKHSRVHLDDSPITYSNWAAGMSLSQNLSTLKIIIIIY